METSITVVTRHHHSPGLLVAVAVPQVRKLADCVALDHLCQMLTDVRFIQLVAVCISAKDYSCCICQHEAAALARQSLLGAL